MNKASEYSRISNPNLNESQRSSLPNTIEHRSSQTQRERARYETATEESDENNEKILGEQKTGWSDSELTASSTAASSHLSCHTTDRESSGQGRPETEERRSTWFNAIQI